MKAFLEHFILTALIAALPALASAQGRVPATDSGALGIDFGVFLPREDRLANGPTLEGFYEYYFTPRGSLRVGLGWMQPDFDDNEGDESLRYLRVPVDFVYNWEGGAVHPFAGAGIGAYFIQARKNGDNVGESESKLGGTLFGGAEFFAGPRLSVKGEARYHLVSDIGALNPGGLALTIGLKTYF
jgi:hypothetical protein